MQDKLVQMQIYHKLDNWFNQNHLVASKHSVLDWNLKLKDWKSLVTKASEQLLTRWTTGSSMMGNSSRSLMLLLQSVTKGSFIDQNHLNIWKNRSYTKEKNFTHLFYEEDNMFSEDDYEGFAFTQDVTCDMSDKANIPDSCCWNIYEQETAQEYLWCKEDTITTLQHRSDYCRPARIWYSLVLWGWYCQHTITKQYEEEVLCDLW